MAKLTVGQKAILKGLYTGKQYQLSGIHGHYYYRCVELRKSYDFITVQALLYLYLCYQIDGILYLTVEGEHLAEGL